MDIRVSHTDRILARHTPSVQEANQVNCCLLASYCARVRNPIDNSQEAAMETNYSYQALSRLDLGARLLHEYTLQEYTLRQRPSTGFCRPAVRYCILKCS